MNKYYFGRAVHLCAALLPFIGAGIFWPISAVAHSAERGFVMLLPTGYYLTGGAIVVFLSFLLLALLPNIRWRFDRSIGLFQIRKNSRIPFAVGLISFAIFAAFLAIGFTGARDPMRNLLPLGVWTFWWVGMTLLHAVIGNIWAIINPWRGPYQLLFSLLLCEKHKSGFIAYPNWLSHWPTVMMFAVFAWFELIYLAPNDPEKLAIAVLVYWLITFSAMIIFGGEQWFAKGECFSLFFRLISKLAPIRLHRDQSVEPDGPRLSLTLPALAAVSMPALPISGTLFILLTLGTVSFDGLSKSFFWLGTIGINPLEFPGRSAVSGINSFGLVALWMLLAAAYFFAVWLGCRLAGQRTQLSLGLGLFAISILPISLGYHFAHYLTLLLVNAQYFIVALSDPFTLGWDLLNLGDFHVTTSFLNNHANVELIWQCQAATIVIVHVVAILLAHGLALRMTENRRQAIVIESPLAILMVAYTLFGLWLLSTPVVT